MSKAPPRTPHATAHRPRPAHLPLTPDAPPSILPAMPSLPRRLAALALLLLVSCADTRQYQSHWTLYPRTPAEALAIAQAELQGAGYRISPTDASALEGTFSNDACRIRLRIDVRAAGNECEIRITTVGEAESKEAPRIRNAYERIAGRLDTALRR